MLTLQGSVKDKKTAIPISGAKLALVRWEKPTETHVLSVEVGLASIIDSGPKFVIECEVQTDKNGTFYIPNLQDRQYRLLVSAFGYNTKEDDFSPEQGKRVIELDVELDRLPRAELKGKVLVTNIDSSPLSGVKLRIMRGETPVASAVTDSSGSYAGILLPDGDYLFSVENCDEKLVKPTSDTWASVIVPDVGTSMPPHDVPVEMLSVPTARLGLTKKKFLGKGGGPVIDGYCKMVRLKPDGTLDKIAEAQYPNASKGDGYGWFEFHDLVPGVYAVTLYKPGGKGLNELPKYSATFSIGRHELQEFLTHPYLIGGNDGKHDLLVSWESIDEVKDQVDTITGMVKDVTGILSDLGIKVPGSK